MNKHINSSQIESWLHSKLKGLVSDNVFAGSLPSTLDADYADMVMIDIANVRDTSEFGRVRGEAVVNVFCYVRPTSNGRKNVGRMNKMEDALAELIETDRDEHYLMTEMYSDSDYDRYIGYHYKITSIKIQIF